MTIALRETDDIVSHYIIVVPDQSRVQIEAAVSKLMELVLNCISNETVLLNRK